MIKAFKIKIFNKKIPVILFDTRKEIIGLSEYQAGGFWNNKVIFGTPVNLKHEIVHAIDSYILKGENSFFKEGLANWFKYINDGLDLSSKYHFYAKYMLKYSSEYRNLTYDELYKKIFLNWKNGYTFGASFIGFFIEHHGIDNFKNFYVNIQKMDENQFKEYIMPYMIKWIQWLKFENIEFNYMESFFEFFKGKEINNLNIDLKKWIKIKNVYNRNFFVDTNNNIILNKINSNIYSHTSIYNLKENKLNLYNGSFVAISKDYLLTKNSGILNLNLYDLQKKRKLYRIDNEMKNISLGYISEKMGIIYLINGKEIKKYNLYTGKHIK
ncbi:hypothetical protein, partial [Marinitoga sp. 38H-ov]|uniref:hypothetical protein n=1 Tax=Marinitoga sp. 38H-ov TaxID=1755814 RepID=UPI0013EE1D17